MQKTIRMDFFSLIRHALAGLIISIAATSTIAAPSLLLAQRDEASSTSATVSVPRLIRFSGTLVDGRGWPITTSVPVVFAIYSQPDGNERPLWQETQQISPGSKGSFTALLGSTSPTGIPVEIFKSGESQYLAVKPDGEPEQPRVLLVSVPYALKASDAATLGGLPPSAFALAGARPAVTATSTSQIVPDANSNVTTPGGTTGFLPVFTGTTTVGNSILFSSATGIGVGDVPNSTAVFDVSGKSIWRGLLNVSRAGNATSSGGFDSFPMFFQASSYNSSTKTPVLPAFQWQAEPTGNNTASPGATFNLLASATGGTPAETGMFFNTDGTINFAPGQTFPGAGKGTITGVTAGTDLLGGGTSGNVTLSLNTSKLVTGVTAGLGLTGGGTAGAVTLAVDTTKVPTLTDNPTFTGTITANSKIAGKPAIAANGTNGAYGISATSDSAYAGKFYSAAGEIGVYSGIGTATGAIAVYGTAPGTDAIGLWGNADGAGGYGVYAITAGGVDSSGNAPIAVYGEAYNSAGTGIEGFAGAAGTGVAGLSNSGPGIIGTSSSGEGIYGISTSGNAGYFQNSAAETASLYSFNSASADGSPYLPIATYGEAYGTNGIGVQGYGEFGVGVRGFSSEVSNLAEKFQGDGIHAGVWGDIGTGTGYPYLAGVLGSADDNTAGYFQNSSDTYATVGAYNAGSGGKGLFTTFQASTPTGTCGIGSGDMTCSGQLKTLATMGDGVRKVETYAMQSPENWMEDFGSGLIKNGIAIVTIDSAFVETANTAAAYHVFLTPNGDSKGLYVVARTSTTFEVHEAGSGTSTLSFDYRIVAKRRGYEAQRLVDVTERYEAETTAIRTRMLSTKSAPKSIFKLPVRPAPRSIGTRRVVERSGRSNPHSSTSAAPPSHRPGY
jgi:hypothetical protein